MARGERHGVWLYAIAERLAAADFGGLAGVAGEPVRATEAAGLTAVVGDVDLAEFGEAALRRNLEDLAWLEATARAHHRVIDVASGASALGSLLPTRLATVYSSEASMAAIFERRREDFRAALARIRARREWGVKAYVALPPESGTVAGAADQAAGATGQDEVSGPESRGAVSGPGAAYLRRRRDQMSARQNSRRDAMASAGLVHSQLSRYAADTRLHPPQSPQLTGKRALMLLNAAYLLDGSCEGEFASAVTALATAHPSIRLELTGPWPPYSFTGAPEAAP